MAVTCVIVDDSPGFIESAQRLLEAGGIVVVGSCGSQDEAERLITRLRPICVLVDVELGEEDGVQVADRLSTVAGAPVVILVSSHDATDLPLPSGVAGFLSKASLDAASVVDLVER